MGTNTTHKQYKSLFFITSIITIISILLVYKSFLENDKLGLENINAATTQNLMVNMPLRFIPNEGQAGTAAEYHVQGAGHTVLFHEEKVVLRREESIDKKNEIVLEFIGANKNPIIEGNEKLLGVANFFKGSDPSQWQTNLPTYSSIMYKELYPGIDMGYIGEEGKLESEFYVSSNTDYRQIIIEYSGIESKRIREDGALVLETKLGELIENTPYVYQEIDNEIIEIEAQYALIENERIGFELSEYNTNYPVVIDPELVFMSFIDHSSGGWTSAVAFDNEGNLVYAGASNRFFPATDVIDSSNHEDGSSDDGLLLKVDAATGEIIYSALFGGNKQDSFNDIAIDDLGNIYLVGVTVSKNFPVLNALQDSLGGSHDAFLSILNSNGELTYSTYLGGSRTDWALDVTFDGAGNIFMAGRTVSPDFPVKNAFQDTIMGEEKYGDYNGDIFLAKVNFTGDLSYATYLGGSLSDRVEVIAVNNSGELTITGSTTSHDFPLMNAYQNSNTTLLNWESTMFITRFNSTGNGLIYSTYFGGAGSDWASGIDVVSNGETYISGNTTSDDFPVISGESFPEVDSSDGVLISLDNSGQPIFSLRSNVPGSESFDGMARQNDSTLLFMGEDDDSLRIYEKKNDTFFEEIFSFYSDGHSINDIEYGDGSLAFASTYWGTGLGKTVSVKTNGSIDQSLSFARVGYGKIQLDYFDIGIGFGGCLEIKIVVAGALKIDCDDNGYVTVHGTSIGVKAADVKCIRIIGSDGNDDIDLSAVTDDKFSNFDPKKYFAEVFGEKGNDKITGCPDFKNKIKGGHGDDNLLGGNKNDDLAGNNGADTIDGAGGKDNIKFDYDDFVVNGGPDNDIFTTFDDFSVPSFKSINLNEQNTNLENTQNTIVISDLSGIDTLGFSESQTGITLDLTLFNAEQTIDTAGTQIMLQGIFEIITGSEFDDEITISSLADTVRHVDGRDGSDILNFNAEVPGSVDDGSTITTPGFADVTYVNIETVNLSVVTAVEEYDSGLPISFELSNNYPNPFNPSTAIKYSIPFQSSVTLKVFDVIGREVSTLVEAKQPQGNYKVQFDASNLTSGVYFYKIMAGNYIETKKMLLLK